jgi:glycosyltransferase involved in cell wall biosynthesis
MNIVHVTHRAWPIVGGSERHVQEIARRQALDGHQVTIVTTDAADLSALWNRHGRRIDPDVATEYQNVHIKRLPTRCLPFGDYEFAALRRIIWLISHVSKHMALTLARFSPWVPKLQQTLTEVPADLFFAWNLTLEGLTAAVDHAARKRSIPWIAVPLLHLGRSRFYTMRHQLDLLRRAQGILAQTPQDRTFMIEHGLYADKVHIAGPGVNLADSTKADGKLFRQKHSLDGPVILSLGTLCYDKGTHHLISAVRQLCETGHPLTLILIGPEQEAMQPFLEQALEENSTCCRHLGQLSEEEKWHAVDAADIVALPSRTESFGIVYLEAWARGKPVIGARSGAVSNVIYDGVDGLLVEFGDVAGLADAISKLLNHPVLASEMGHRGREKVCQRYTWERQYARLCTAVEKWIE